MLIKALLDDYLTQYYNRLTSTSIHNSEYAYKLTYNKHTYIVVVHET